MILRKDSWTHQEDLTVTETLLEYAKEGKTQKEAFKYLEQILPTRTDAAVQQRWNKHLKKKVIPQPSDPKLEPVSKLDLPLADLVTLMNLPNLEDETILLLNLKIRDIIERSI